MQENIKIAQAKNLSKFGFNQTINIPIDANANVKSVLDVTTYLFDIKVECGNGKAIVNGKVGARVLYLDTDNLTNSVSESVSFSETYVDAVITSSSYLNIQNQTITHNVLDSSNSLKISCDVSISPVAYFNLSLASSIEPNEHLITKKCQLTTNTIAECVLTNFEQVQVVESRDKISKILAINSCFAEENVIAQDGFAIVEGKLCTTILFESDDTIKQIHDESQVKCDVSIANLQKDDTLDLNFTLDKSKTVIETELEENTSIVTLKNQIFVRGVVLRTAELNLVDDVFSTTNVVDFNTSVRELSRHAEKKSTMEIVTNEINLNSNEPAIDEVVCTLNPQVEITNTYIKDEQIYVEGVISSNLTYIDENKEFKHKELESPFIVNTKINVSTLGCVNSSACVLGTKVKVKRGTIIDVESTLSLSITIYAKDHCTMVDGVTLGKALDENKYDFQIFLTKPNETSWELCKRIKISPEQLLKLNPDLPPIMTGTERVIIRR